MRLLHRLLLPILALLPVLCLQAGPRNGNPELEAALTGTTWKWGVESGPKGRVSFRKDHVAKYFHPNGDKTECHWWATSAHTIHFQWAKDPERFNADAGIDLVCNPGVTKFTNPRREGKVEAIKEGGATPAAVELPPAKACIEILSEESVNITGWITSPLGVKVPEAIWENLNFLKEALRDEAASEPKASSVSYDIAVRLCFMMVKNLEERDQFTARSGGAAVLHQKSNLTLKQRNRMTWPKYMLEKDERKERHAKARNAAKMPGYNGIEWQTRGTIIKREIEKTYSQLRAAMREK